jgi:hypothetical protein
MMNALKLFGKALPVILANAPAIVEAVRQIRQALKPAVPNEPVPVTAAD